MFVNFREVKRNNVEHRWYRRTDGHYMPTWAMVAISRFNRRYRSGNGIYNVVSPGIVMKVADYDNGVLR